MAKALKPVVILLLLLCIGALVLGIQLFGKREVLKGRVQQTEQALAKIAENLHYDGFRVSALAVDKVEGLDQMKAPLSQLAAAAALQYTELQDTKQDLETTRQDLAMTKDELERTIADLDRTKAQVETLTTALNEKTAQLAAMEVRVDTLEQEKVSLTMQIDDLNNQLVQSEDELRDAQDKILTLEQAINLMDLELGQGRTHPIPKGLTGRVLHVNKDWNFVVIDLGSDDGLVPDAEMLIHRKDKLIGKIVISGLSRSMSIAELDTGWTQTSVKEGDFVVF